MKTNLLKMKRVLSAVLLILLLNAAGMTKAFGLDFAEGIFNYTVNDDGTTVTVTGLVNGTNYYGAVNIPDEVTFNENTYTVTKIAASAFQNCVGITSVTIPSSMTFIGDRAFYGCSGLITLNYNAINCSLGTIDYTSSDTYYYNGSYQYRYTLHWLYSCTSLVSLNIGDGVQTIPDYFVGAYRDWNDCAGYNLTGSVIIPNSVTSIGKRAFYNCSNISTVRIGNSVTSIGTYAFYNCSNMGSLTIGSSVSSIGTYAFASCSKLTSIVLPSSMTTISNNLFDYCSLLSSVTIPNTIVSIGNYAFRNCKLASLNIPNSVVSIGESAFSGNSSLTSVSFGGSLASIGASSFYNCSNLTNLVIPNSVVSIGNSAFYGCSRISNLTIGDGVASIGNSAFYNCSGLTSMTLGNSLASIGETAFYGCTNLPSINMPVSVTSIGVNVFGNCTKLGHISVASENTVYDSRNNCNAIIETASNKLVAGCKNTVIPNTVTVIGNSAFYSCTVLNGTLNLPNSITTIEAYAFYGCSGLSGHLNLPNSVVTIEASAFQNCVGITSVTIPSTMTFIGDRAFYGCSGLITLNYNAINCSLGTIDYTSSDTYYYNGSYQYRYTLHWLYSCTSLVSLNIGDGVQTIPDYFVGAYRDWNDCAGYNLTGSVIIPNSVTSIGKRAFYNCSNISTVRIGNSVTSIGTYAFYNCSNMGSLTIGSSVSSIGTYAFASCSKLTSVVLPSSMTTISDDLFYGCSLLSSVTIPNTIVSIGEYAFRNCKLSSLNIPNSVVSIGQSAFYGCSSLTSVSLGENVASLGASSFYNCSNIASMTVRPSNPPAVLSNAFYGVPTDIPVEVPCHTLSDYQAASGWSSFTNMYENCDASYEIAVSANPAEGGTVTGGGTYNHGANCTLTATANTGYTFVNWTKNEVEVSTNAEYTFTVTEAATYVANFSQNSYTISVSANPTAGGTVSGGGTYNHGANCTLTATANTGYTFVNWTKNGEVVSTEATYTFTVTEAATYVANFQQQTQSYAINVSANPTAGGTVSGGGTYNHGANCTLTATANTGYTFVNWTKNGEVVSTEATYTFTVTEAATYVANFQQQTQSYAINVSANPTAGGTVSGGGTYNHGANCTLTAIANSGYTFTNWTENDEVVSTDATYIFTVTGDRTLVANFTQNGGGGAPTGAINGKFSVSAEQQVYFSQGNLQYIGSASTPYWKFANHQWEYLGTTTGQNSDNQNVDRDLFGWGTSGYNHGAVCYQPWSTSLTSNSYYAYGSATYNLYDQTGQADWGYNPISNGGNAVNQWRTLTNVEWDYVFNTRCTSSEIRYAKANVNNINGVILLPDDWSSSTYSLNSTDNSEASFSSNIITAAQWMTLENAGAVFLPAAGGRNGTSVNGVGSHGKYWSASYSGSYMGSQTAIIIYFYDSKLSAITADFINTGESVRLVRVAENYSYGINAVPSPAEGGEVSGGGTYEEGAECTLTATTNAGYTFVNWTEDGEVVSTEATYTFTVTGDRTLVANFTQNGGGNVPTGAINGKFSVSEDNQIYFSQGNLQYQASTDIWKFAENQYDYVGSTNSNISSSYSGWIDLFGWGTSGYHDANDSYNVNYQPWSTSTSEVNSSYNKYGYGPSTNMTDPNLTGTSANYDWGVYNPISNGGNTANQWRTLTKAEWQYVFNTRSTTSGIRYAKANVNNVNGVILLPDDWSASTYTLNNTNSSSDSFTSNTLTASQWNILEQAGAVFLPAAGLRIGASVILVGSGGSYWSASYYDSDYAYCVYFNDSDLGVMSIYRYDGRSVRLVCPAENYSYGINAVASPAEGGTVSGGGNYEEGATCTLTATPSAGYIFVNWTEDGEVVSTEATYTFTVTETATYVANFTQNGGGENIVFADANVKAICVANWDTNGDGELSYAEAAAITTLNNSFSFNDDIVSFDELQYFTGLTSLNDYEFYYCSSLSSVNIPNTIISIGQEAFSGCGNLALITSSPIVPPTLGDNAFEGVPNTVVVNVPCAYGYQNADGWSSFTNYEEFASDMCTIAFADANVKAICVANWDTNGDSELSYVEAAAVTDLGTYFKNNSTITSFDELEYFTGLTTLPNTAFMSCTSLASITLPSSIASLGAGAFFNCSGLSTMTVYAETPPAVGSNTFGNVPSSIVIYVPCGTTDEYHAASGWSSFSNIVGMCPFETQTISLSSGVNWVSFNVNITLADLKAALVEALPDDNVTVTIKSKQKSTRYQNGRWSGSFNELDMANMYMIIVSDAFDITLEGTRVDLTELTVTISKGANWIAYPLDESMTITDIFGSFSINNDQIKSKKQTARYNNGRWTGNLRTLEPGQGYIFISEEPNDRIFTFPISPNKGEKR